MTTEIKKHGAVWQWRIRHNGKLYGGLGRTKADAENDCAIVKRQIERDMPRHSNIAALFGCTTDQLRAQYGRNAAQLEAMADKAKGKTVNGFTEAELRAKAAYCRTMANS